MKRAVGELLPLERGVLADLHNAVVMSTRQLWRLRFAGTTVANCRLRLERLVHRGMVRRLWFGPGIEACWCVTAAGSQAIGRGEPEGLAAAQVDVRALGRVLLQAEGYVVAKLAERVRDLDTVLPPTRRPNAGGPRGPGGSSPDAS